MILLLLIPLIPGLFIIWGAGGIQRAKAYPGKIIKAKKPLNLSTPDVYKVLSWNVGYGQGLGSEGGELYEKKSAEEFKSILKQMALFLSKMKPDLILLQEVDLNSSRSHNQNQLEQLLAELPEYYAAYGLNWDANYVPFPYWPISKHFGQVRAAGVILSRYPINSQDFVLLPKPENNPWWYNLYYLFRYYQKVGIEIGQKSFSVYNTHLEAFDQDGRIQQARILKEVCEKEIQRGRFLLLGGDLNSIPHYAKVKEGFTDYPKDRYTKDITLALMESMKGAKSSLPETVYKAYESQYFTFPSDKPDRRLDHIFVNERTEVLSIQVLKEAGTLSDHLPIFMELRLNSNQWA